jgi:excisionase family DNA binding protein
MGTPNDFGLYRAAYSVAGLAEVTSLRRTKIFQLVKAGELKATKCGRRTLFLATDVAEFLSRLPQAEGL